MMWKSAGTSVAWLCVLGAALFAPAGTTDWLGGWIFLAEMVLLSGATVAWLAKIFMLIMIVTWHGWMVLMSLDVKRWHLSEAPNWVMYAGAVLILLGLRSCPWSWACSSCGSSLRRRSCATDCPDTMNIRRVSGIAWCPGYGDSRRPH
jgi:hypothetical protein